MPSKGDTGPDHGDLTQSEGTSLNPRLNDVDYSSTNASVTGNSTTTVPPPYTYQELPGGVTCPTCSGAGRIPRGQEDDLVALIPYRDDRLRPRRTGLYVFLSIVVCGAIAGILCAFLLTKPVYMSIQNITTTGIYLNTTTPKLVMNLKITYNISNSNFPSIFPTNITVIGQQSFNTQPVVSNTSNIDLRVWGRSKTHFIVNVTAVFVDQYIPKYCASPIRGRIVPIEFSSSLQYRLMAQVSSISSHEYKQVECNQRILPRSSEQRLGLQQGDGLPAD